MMEFKGLSINSGSVAGLACLYSDHRHKNIVRFNLEDDAAVENEQKRFEAALIASSAQLDTVAADVVQKIGMAEAEIFLAQKHIMNDPAILAAIRKGIAETRRNAEAVIAEVFEKYENKFSQLKNEYLRQRAADIGEIRRRLLNHLRQEEPRFMCEGQQECTRGANRIIVADELTADMMMHMKYESVLGFVTEHGGISSHAAIIARSLGVPAVTGVHDIMQQVRCSIPILIDGDSGIVIVEPTPRQIAAHIPVEPVTAETVYAISTPAGMEVCANASLIEDVKLAHGVNADGIGLFRTEISFLKAERLLSEEEQFEYYLQIVKTMEGKPVTFRLLDIGGDKPLPFMRIQKESNPYLGWRGARFLLGSPDIMAPQIRALGRLSMLFPVKIMVPMIVDAAQQQQVNSAIASILQSVPHTRENIQIGAMFEVPSACLQAREIFKFIDFGSIGSNDLIQYLFAVDRNNELVSQDYNPEHPVLWETLRLLSVAAQEAGKPLSICGEMAGRSEIPTRLIQTGITILSVSPRLIPAVRNELVTMNNY